MDGAGTPESIPVRLPPQRQVRSRSRPRVISYQTVQQQRHTLMAYRFVLRQRLEVQNMESTHLIARANHPAVRLVRKKKTVSNNCRLENYAQRWIRRAGIYLDWKSTRLNSSHIPLSRMP